MLGKFKNIIIFVVIGLVMVLAYMFFMSGNNEDAGLISTSTNTSGTSSQELPDPSAIGDDSEIAKDFLALLLSVKNITLNDQIFSDSSFKSLKDSSIEIIHDNSEGRPNPFAPIGTDATSTVINAFTSSTQGSQNTSTSGNTANTPGLGANNQSAQTEEDFDVFSNVDLSEPDLSFDGAGDIGN